MSLRELLEEYKTQPFLLVQSGGNHGDHTNYAGLNKLVRMLNISYRELRWNSPQVQAPKVSMNTVIYQHGGGGFICLWKWQPQLMRLLRQKYPQNMLIVGPSTVALDEPYLKKLLPKDSANIMFFARERVTYEFMKDRFYSNVFLDDCPAFSLTRGDFDVEYGEDYHLLIERCDLEKVPFPSELNRKDFDRVVDPNPCGANFSRQDYLKLHAHAKSITTNHVHSAVLGAIIEKPTTLFRNNYHKNRSIWEYSLKKRGVKWIGPY